MYNLFLVVGVSSDEWLNYPIGLFFSNIYEGMFCLFFQEDIASNDYRDVNCKCSSWLIVYILIYVISTIFVLECINKIVQTNTAILNRAMSISVFFSFVTLGIYGTLSNQANISANEYQINFSDILSIIILLTGMEIYGNEQEPDIEYITSST